ERGSFPPGPNMTTEKRASSLVAARKAFGSTPLWLGRRFDGHPLDSVALGTERARSASASTFDSARFVELRYGPVTVREFGAGRAVGQTGGPPAGRAIRANSGFPGATLTRDGFLILISKRHANVNRDMVLAVSGALQRIPPG